MSYPTLQEAAGRACSDLADVTVGDVSWLCHRADVEVSGVTSALDELVPLLELWVPRKLWQDIVEGARYAVSSTEGEVQAAEVLALHLSGARS